MRGVKLKKSNVTRSNESSSKGTIDYYLLSTIIILLAIGIVMVYSAAFINPWWKKEIVCTFL